MDSPNDCVQDKRKNDAAANSHLGPQLCWGSLQSSAFYAIESSYGVYLYIDVTYNFDNNSLSIINAVLYYLSI
jgi:hypothetical protein